MKSWIVVGFFIFAGSSLAQDIGIIKRFENRRPALARFKVDKVDLYDFNRDGTRDIATVFNDTLWVFDPSTKDTLWQFDITTLGASWADMRLFGYVSWEAANPVAHAIFSTRPGSQDRLTFLVSVTTGEIALQLDAAIPVAVLRHPKSGREVLLGYDTREHVVLAIGSVSQGGMAHSRAEGTSRPLESFAGDYQLELKFQAEPGQRLAYDPELFDPTGDMDINGDGQMDIAILVVDRNANNQPVGMVVRSGDDYAVLWRFPFPPEHKENILKGFFGFVDANGDGEKEAIVGENLAITLDGSVHTIAENFVTLDVNDVDGDGFEDIIGLNTTDSTVVVYGTMPPTSVENYDPAAIHFQLFQNYPNPFNPSTTISYSVAAASEVQLRIYNPLGQLVRTLVSGQKRAGDYTLTWDGRDDAGRLLSSGPYFYRLRVGEIVQTRRMLFLK